MALPSTRARLEDIDCGWASFLHSASAQRRLSRAPLSSPA